MERNERDFRFLQNVYPGLLDFVLTKAWEKRFYER
jgi:hypothetical protein